MAQAGVASLRILAGAAKLRLGVGGATSGPFEVHLRVFFEVFEVHLRSDSIQVSLFWFYVKIRRTTHFHKGHPTIENL